MRRQGVDEAWCALEEMQRKGIPADKYTISRMLTKTVGDGRIKVNPTRVYRGITLVERFVETQPHDVDEVLFNALLDTCCRLKDLKRLEATMSKMRELKVAPSPVTLGVLVKTYGQAGDLQKVLQVWEEMEKQRGQANAVTYGCMIDACVKCGNLDKAVEIFEGMRKTGKHRNTILYTTLIKGYGSEKDLQSALDLFYEMPAEGVQYNTITYNSVLDACVKCGELKTAEGLLREMTASTTGVEPDLITFSTLLKGYCQNGDLDKALQVVEAIKARGLRCDELVYNTLMDGCVKAGDFSAGIGLFEEMVQTGMRPSAITHSILARLYQRAGYEDDASEAVAQLYQHVGLERPNASNRAGGKGAGRRWHAFSPHGQGGEVRQAPMGSPSAEPWVPSMGFHGDCESARSENSGWNAWSGMPPLPRYDGNPADSSAASASNAHRPYHPSGKAFGNLHGSTFTGPCGNEAACGASGAPLGSPLGFGGGGACVVSMPCLGACGPVGSPVPVASPTVSPAGSPGMVPQAWQVNAYGMFAPAMQARQRQPGFQGASTAVPPFPITGNEPLPGSAAVLHASPVHPSAQAPFPVMSPPHEAAGQPSGLPPQVQAFFEGWPRGGLPAIGGEAASRGTGF